MRQRVRDSCHMRQRVQDSRHLSQRVQREVVSGYSAGSGVKLKSL